MPIPERIATFDQDGTLWVEHPIYTQFIYAIDRIKALMPLHPEWQNQEPFKAMASGQIDFLKNLTKESIEKIMAITHSGMTVDNYMETAGHWIDTAIQPRFKRPYTELIYQPMLEVIDLFQENNFTVYIVSGGGQEFIRTYSEKVYGIPPERVIGTTGKTKYEYANGQPVLIKLPQILFIDDKEGKPESINLFIGRRPIAAFGNSTGDQQMLEWTQAGKGKRLELLVHHDDAIREYAYGPETKVGTFSDALMNEAKEKDWIVVSMKNDWKIIFPWEKP